MDNDLEIIHTRDRHGNPLAVVKNFPGLDADMYPAQMREMSNALMRAADACENNVQNRRFSSLRPVKYPLTSGGQP